MQYLFVLFVGFIGAFLSVMVVGWAGEGCSSVHDRERGILQVLDLFKIFVSYSPFCYIVLCVG